METTKQISFMKTPTGYLGFGKDFGYGVTGSGSAWVLDVIDSDGKTVSTYMTDRLKDAKAIASKLELVAA